MKLVPLLKEIKRRAHGSAREFKRWFPGPLIGLPSHQLSPTQVFPVGRNLIPSIQMSVAQRFQDFRLSKDLKIASIGSCFAEEFAYYMLERGFNYLRAEADTFSGSANWGRVFTVPNLLQIFEYSLTEQFPVLVERSEKGWFDPLREHAIPFYPLREDAATEIAIHRDRSRSVLMGVEALVITLGQNEAWLDSNDRRVWARRPPKELLESNPGRFSAVEFSFEENLAQLEKALGLLFAKNPAVRVILTVSPVPAYATFSRTDVVSAAFAAKCLLRAVADAVEQRHPAKVFYFPSFEMVLCDNPKNFVYDNRHVRRTAVARIFRVLSSLFER